MSTFEPTIIAFLCNWCSYAASDSAGSRKLEHPAGVRIVRVMCSGRIEPELILKAFAEGADGVAVLGCHPGDCHYKEGNYKALRRYHVLKQMLSELSIEPERFRLEWVSAAEADRFAIVIREMYEQVRSLGPRKVEAVS